MHLFHPRHQNSKLTVACCVLITLLLATGTLHATKLQKQETFSRHGRYLVTLETPTQLNQLNTEVETVVTITDAKGQPIQPADITIGGGMENHAHGLSTQPIVEEYLNNGRWRVSGLEFSMHGSWQIMVQILDDIGWDFVRFDVFVGDSSSAGAGNARFITKQDLRLLNSLTISALQPITDITNPVLQNALAAKTGHRLFFDTNLSGNQILSCASCHQPTLSFTDGRKHGVGQKPLNTNVPTLMGIAHQKWFFYDGRRDSLWAQAITPLEAPAEMNAPRSDVIRYFFSVPSYKAAYQTLFGSVPDLSQLPANATPMGNSNQKQKWNQTAVTKRRQWNLAFANIGRLLAAYEAKLTPAESRFDQFVSNLQTSPTQSEPLFSKQEIAGLKVFLQSKNGCLNCHNGPLFSNGQFHNVGTRRPEDLGRQAGAQAVLLDPFNCQGRYSGVARKRCKKLKYMAAFDATYYSAGAYKTATLRNIGLTAPYMHDGRHTDLNAVIEHYRHPPENQSHELTAINITDNEAQALVGFLKTLTSTENRDNPWLHPPLPAQ